MAADTWGLGFVSCDNSNYLITSPGNSILWSIYWKDPNVYIWAKSKISPFIWPVLWRHHTTLTIPLVKWGRCCSSVWIVKSKLGFFFFIHMPEDRNISERDEQIKHTYLCLKARDFGCLSLVINWCLKKCWFKAIRMSPTHHVIRVLVKFIMNPRHKYLLLVNAFKASFFSSFFLFHSVILFLNSWNVNGFSFGN